MAHMIGEGIDPLIVIRPSIATRVDSSEGASPSYHYATYRVEEPLPGFEAIVEQTQSARRWKSLKRAQKDEFHLTLCCPLIGAVE